MQFIYITIFLCAYQAVGLAAKQGILRNQLNTICEVNQLVGRPFNDPQVEEIVKSSSVKVGLSPSQ